MSMVQKLELLLNGQLLPCYSILVEKQEKRGADMCRFEVRKTYSISLGADVKVRVSGTSVYLFAGSVVQVQDEYDKKIVTAYSYGYVLDTVRVFPARFYRNMSVENIVNDLVVNVAGLSWGGASSTGLTLAEYEAYGTVGDNVRKLAKMVGFDFWTEVDSNGVLKFYFKQASAADLGVSLVLSGATSNARRTYYDSGIQEVVNAVEVYGRSMETVKSFKYRKVYNRMGGMVILNSYPTSIRVFGDGIPLAEKQDYFVYLDKNPYIIVNGSYDELEIWKGEDLTPYAYAQNSSSISQYGKRMKSYVFDNVTTESKLQSIATTLVNVYGQPRKTLKVRVPGILLVRDGGYVRVTDSYLGLSNTPFVVRKVSWRYPEGVTELELGEFRPDIYEFEREVGNLVESTRRTSLFNVQKFEPFSLYISNPSSGVYTFSKSLVATVGGSRTKTSQSNVSPTLLQLRMQVIGKYTVSIPPSGSSLIALMAVEDTGGVARRFYSRLVVELYYDYYQTQNDIFDANANGEIQIRAQIYESPWLLQEPPSSSCLLLPESQSSWITITLSGVRRLLPTMLGMAAVVSYNASAMTISIYWGNTTNNVYETGFYNVGVEKM